MVRSALAVSAGALASAWLWTNTCAAEAPCSARVTREDVVACAQRTSPEVRASKLGIEASRARELSASTWLPSNPSLSVGLGKRTATALEPSSLTWNAALAQELEIGGQRSARLETARAETDAASKRAEETRRAIATAALDGYFEALAALEQQQLAEALARVASALSAAARARSEAGLFAPIEADVAEAAALRVVQEQFAAERRLSSSLASLATMLGLDPARPPAVEGELSPWPTPLATEALVASALENRADLKAASAEQRAAMAKVTLYSRSRVPNPTLSVFAESDRSDEKRFGVGLSLPIPLPAPLGHTYRGEIAEAQALAERASTEAERIRRLARLEVTTALDSLLSRKREVDAFPPDLLDRAKSGLEALAREVESGRLPVREALIAQQSLIELLRAFIDARLQLCRASVELVRVAALPLDEVRP